MFEALVSSRIRRALLEHIVAHPEGRFYLRGLAKQLGLPITPVRRELKRLEQLGVLAGYHEANIRFYTVNQHSPAFAELKPLAAASPPAPQPIAGLAPAPVLPSTPQRRPVPRAALGLCAAALVIGISMFFILRTSNFEPAEHAEMRAVQPRTSGEMRSLRWRLLPGPMGGFSHTDGMVDYTGEGVRR